MKVDKERDEWKSGLLRSWNPWSWGDRADDLPDLLQTTDDLHPQYLTLLFVGEAKYTISLSRKGLPCSGLAWQCLVRASLLLNFLCSTLINTSLWMRTKLMEMIQCWPWEFNFQGLISTDLSSNLQDRPCKSQFSISTYQRNAGWVGWAWRANFRPAKWLQKSWNMQLVYTMLKVR
jgi:hypothetical protein